MEFMILLGVLVVVGWLVWRLVVVARRQRQASELREAEMMAQFAAMRAAAALRRDPADAPSGLVATNRGQEQGAAAIQAAPAAQPQKPHAPQDQAASAPPAARGRAYLGKHHAIAYRLLRVALPEREIFARSSLRAVLGAESVGKDLRLDFVVCDRTTRSLAAVDLIRNDDLPPVVALKKEKLEEAGLIYLRWAPEALPTREQVARQLGSSSAG